MAERNQQFDNFQQWLDHASTWLTRHPDYYDAEFGTGTGWCGRHFKAICFDAHGRLCWSGAQFARARDEKTFPVRWIWPDQVPFFILHIWPDGDILQPEQRRWVNDELHKADSDGG